MRLTFWGFDEPAHRRAAGEPAAADDLVTCSAALRARFPIEEMRITTKAELDAPPTGDGNDTGASTAGRPSATVFSQHAYGLAVDVEPVPEPLPQGMCAARARVGVPDRGLCGPG